MRKLHWCLLSMLLPGLLALGLGVWIRYIQWNETDWLVLLFSDLRMFDLMILGLALGVVLAVSFLKVYPILAIYAPVSPLMGLAVGSNILGPFMIVMALGLNRGLTLEAAQYLVSLGWAIFGVPTLMFTSSVIGEIVLRLGLYEGFSAKDKRAIASTRERVKAAHAALSDSESRAKREKIIVWIAVATGVPVFCMVAALILWINLGNT